MASVKGAAPPIELVLDRPTRAVLKSIARAQSLPYRDVVRAKMILLVADGHSVTDIVRQLGTQRRIVRKWADRFKRYGLLGLVDAPRSGRPPRFSPDRRDAPGEARVRAS